MKLFKQPIFYIGLGALVGLIATIVISSMANPRYAIVDQFEKALNKKDPKLLEKCIYDDGEHDIDGESLFYAIEDGLGGWYGDSADISDYTFEILTGQAQAGEEDQIKIPSIMIVRDGDGDLVRRGGINIILLKRDGKYYIDPENIW